MQPVMLRCKTGLGGHGYELAATYFCGRDQLESAANSSFARNAAGFAVI